MSFRASIRALRNGYSQVRKTISAQSFTLGGVFAADTFLMRGVAESCAAHCVSSEPVTGAHGCLEFGFGYVLQGEAFASLPSSYLAEIIMIRK